MNALFKLAFAPIAVICTALANPSFAIAADLYLSCGGTKTISSSHNDPQSSRIKLTVQKRDVQNFLAFRLLGEDTDESLSNMPVTTDLMYVHDIQYTGDDKHWEIYLTADIKSPQSQINSHLLIDRISGNLRFDKQIILPGGSTQITTIDAECERVQHSKPKF